MKQINEKEVQTKIVSPGKTLYVIVIHEFNIDELANISKKYSIYKGGNKDETSPRLNRGRENKKQDTSAKTLLLGVRIRGQPPNSSKINYERVHMEN